jgi:CheY-like chemotaxis protein
MNTVQPFLILHVEDEPAHAVIVRRNLAGSPGGARLNLVKDGRAALDYLFRQGAFLDPESSPRPDLIVMDLRLPKVDGLEVMRQLKQDPDLQPIPVVVLTTSSAERDIRDAYAMGVTSYLVKPTSLQEFTEMMDAFRRYWLELNHLPAQPLPLKTPLADDDEVRKETPR